ITSRDIRRAGTKCRWRRSLRGLCQPKLWNRRRKYRRYSRPEWKFVRRKTGWRWKRLRRDSWRDWQRRDVCSRGRKQCGDGAARRKDRRRLKWNRSAHKRYAEARDSRHPEWREQGWPNEKVCRWRLARRL